METGTTNFYCIAREDGFVPCEAQCYACLKMIQDLEGEGKDLKKLKKK